MATREHFFDDYNAAAPPPWDIGCPQPVLISVFDELDLGGSVLDLGCGTGENVLELARRGLDAWGLDGAPGAIARAEKKRDERGLAATFVLGDALDLSPLGRTFDTVTDCGLFHVLADDERRAYRRALDRVLRPGGRFLMLGLTANDGERLPHGYTAEALRALFAEGYREAFLRLTSFAPTPVGEQLPAWLSLFVREG